MKKLGDDHLIDAKNLSQIGDTAVTAGLKIEFWNLDCQIQCNTETFTFSLLPWLPVDVIFHI